MLVTEARVQAFEKFTAAARDNGAPTDEAAIAETVGNLIAFGVDPRIANATADAVHDRMSPAPVGEYRPQS